MTSYFGHRSEGGGFDDVFPSRTQVSMCGRGPIVALMVREAGDDAPADALYWGWEPLDDQGRFCMIFRNRRSLEMCFPYGAAAEVARGRGRPVRLIIEEEYPG